LIGDGASTLPFELNSNSNSIQCITKNLFQSGSNDIFYISSFESVDVGQVEKIFDLKELKLKKFFLVISFTTLV